MNWYVLITSPRMELNISNELKKIGINTFCPMKTELRKWSDRNKKVKVPLLPSMVLVNLHDIDRNKVFHVSGIKRYLFYLNKPAIVYEEEIDILKNYDQLNYIKIKKNNFIDNEISQIPGFENFSGKVIKRSNNCIWIKFKESNFNVKFDLV